MQSPKCIGLGAFLILSNAIAFGLSIAVSSLFSVSPVNICTACCFDMGDDEDNTGWFLCAAAGMAGGSPSCECPVLGLAARIAPALAGRATPRARLLDGLLTAGGRAVSAIRSSAITKGFGVDNWSTVLGTMASCISMALFGLGGNCCSEVKPCS